MQDDEITLCNACTDLVSLKSAEAFPQQLLANQPAGAWIGVADFCGKVGLVHGGIGESVFATWLPDPIAHESYVVIFFYDDESKWSMTAQYNRGRFMRASAGSKSNTGAAAAILSALSLPSPERQPAE
jgi:hypothetical protein